MWGSVTIRDIRPTDATDSATDPRWDEEAAVEATDSLRSGSYDFLAGFPSATTFLPAIGTFEGWERMAKMIFAQ